MHRSNLLTCTHEDHLKRGFQVLEAFLDLLMDLLDGLPDNDGPGVLVSNQVYQRLKAALIEHAVDHLGEAWLPADVTTDLQPLLSWNQRMADLETVTMGVVHPGPYILSKADVIHLRACVANHLAADKGEAAVPIPPHPYFGAHSEREVTP